ncbi:MFS transporter [Frigoribacterium sp. CFBP 8754]|uniref:MFS transporter n=1 Tax=unclassified Frigoribacterium TaxID=2627005 RepID=UPI0016278E2C|nr:MULTISPECIES: MFS transporter [unclassified Frigoribacterium]MBD8660100.1 MFS transporter [Frigoribacterium sp. CFBP 8754]MBD8726444.1 MFS transporter [Frigoribacterium sp. CFBP 13707]QNE43194.1 MFS transporter [Frigoribacterium sp. NBH87]
MSSPTPAASLRSVALAAFLPAALFAIGEGAIIPIIPVVASDLGASLPFAAFVAALILVGELIGDVPSGWLVSRIGERTAMISAALVSTVGLLTCVAAPNEWVLALGVLLIGLSTAVFALARHAFMTSFVPVEIRARALSSLGGVFRFGFFVGPFLAAGVIHLTGSTQSAFWIHVGGCLGAAAVLLVLRDPTAVLGERRAAAAAAGSPVDPAAGATAGPTPGEVAVEKEARGLFATLARHRGVLLRLGSGAALIGAMRAGRQVILPLWAVSIGVDAPQTALVIGIAGAVDFALFYTSGQIMDRWGRLWSAVPSMVGLSVSYLALSLTHDLDARVGWFIAVAMFMSLANGIGSGILMTLGADLADRADPAPFLGAWRFTGDAGSAAAPLLISGLTALVSISVASGVMGLLGLAGAAILLRYVPRYSPHVPRDRR